MINKIWSLISEIIKSSERYAMKSNTGQQSTLKLAHFIEHLIIGTTHFKYVVFNLLFMFLLKIWESKKKIVNTPKLHQAQKFSNLNSVLIAWTWFLIYVNHGENLKPVFNLLNEVYTPFSCTWKLYMYNHVL